ncbi:MAG: hypothetical protein E7379_03530 [Clostridiales bacterium]|nr:hypothetical protein [Clostridiales bacterium]
MAKAISNKKFKATVISLCAGFLVVVGALIGVWAASSQNLKAGFKVDYEIGANVAAEVRTEYIIQGDVAATTVTKNANDQVVNNSNGYIPFNAGEEEGTKNVYIGKHELTPEKQKLSIYFTIHSLMPQDYVQTSIQSTYTQRTNVSIETEYYDSTSFSHSSSATTIAEASYEELPSKHIPAGGYRIIKITITVDNENIDALCAGNFTIGLYYSEIEGAAAVSTPTQLLSVMQVPGAIVKLEENIDFNDLTGASISSFNPHSTRANEIPYVASLYKDMGDDVYAIFESFNGVLDGNGKTITMPSVGKYKDGAYVSGDAENYIFYDFNGVVKNLTLFFGNIENHFITFARTSSLGIRFENVTTDGSITLASQNTVGNYSPMIRELALRTENAFINCTSSCDISGVSYGSAFLGGYIRKSKTDVIDINGNKIGKSKGFVDSVKVSFINCVNDATLLMRDASMLWGNGSGMALPKNITVSGCVNNGTILGDNQAKLFCALENDYSSTILDYHKIDLPALNNAIEKTFTGTGVCAVNQLEGMSLTEDENGELSLAAPEGNYTFKMTIDVLLFLAPGNTISFKVIIDVTPGELTYGHYRFVDKLCIDTMTGETMTEITGKAGVESPQNAKLYLVEYNGAKYYYMEPADADTVDYYFGNRDLPDTCSRAIYVVAFDSQGNTVGHSMISAHTGVDYIA